MDEVKISGGGLLVCRNPDGSVAWRRAFKNAPTGAGLDHAASVVFSAGSQAVTWYAGLIDLLSFSSLNFADTMALHSGWVEGVLYSGNRPTWVNSEGGQLVASNGPFSFPMTGSGTIHGMFITSQNTPGGKTGTLWATAVLAQDAQFVTGQTITGTYSVAMAGG